MSQFQRNEDMDIPLGVSTIVSRLGENNLNKRISIILKNTAVNANSKITLNLGRQQAVPGKGIQLAVGETWMDTSEQGYECYQGVITATCGVGGTLTIMER